jgi:hypothetical protein
MPKAVVGAHNKRADIYFLAAIVAILWMMLLQGFLDMSFPLGAGDSDAPAQAPRRAGAEGNAADSI